MAEIQHGVRHILSHPTFYNAFQNSLGIPKQREILTRDYLQPKPGQQILDIGCGTCDIIKHLDNYSEDYAYHGIDANQKYIKHARTKWRDRKDFAFFYGLADRSNKDIAPNDYDLVIAFGILHHLEDTEVQSMIESAWKALKVGGRLVTMDPCRYPDLNIIEKLLVKFDRGQNIRTLEEYERLLAKQFHSVQRHIRTGINHLPVRTLVYECVKTA